MEKSGKSRETISSTSDFVILVYPWASPYLDSQMEEGEPFILDLGPHFVSFTRNKNIGGAMQIEAFGSGLRGEIGDWVVLKTSSKKAISESYSDAIFEGQTKFIGQIYSKNVTHVADAEGNLRSYTQYTVREWSHVFHIEVKLDQIALASNAKVSTAERLIAETAGKTTGQEVKLLNDFIKSYFSPFDFSVALLKLVGGLSSNDDRVTTKGFQNLRQVATRLPSVPSSLVEDNIMLFQTPDGEESTFDKRLPWSSGFFWSILGVQKWANHRFEQVFTSVDNLWKNLKLITNTRPISQNNPLQWGFGLSFISALQNQFGDAGIYEMYTDLLYFSNDVLAAPALIVRDRPMTFAYLYKDAPPSAEGTFEWTYLDDLPRVTVSPASVVSITFNTSVEESPNYVRLDFEPGVWKGEASRAESSNAGLFTNIAAQRKFGSVSETRIIKAYIDPDKYTTKKGNSKNVSPEERKNINWFKALSSKLGNYLPNRFLFPRANVYLKDFDYPITVGMPIRIPFEAATIVGFVESINVNYKIEHDGKRKNDIYLELSDCCMENGDKTEEKKDYYLVPIPKEIIASLTKYEYDMAHLFSVLRTWKFKEPGSDDASS